MYKPVTCKLSLGAVVAAMTVVSTGAHAYVGPGLGLGTIGAVRGTLAAVLLAVFAVLYYPIKRLFKKNNTASQAGGQDADPGNNDQQSDDKPS
jgi:hypothetical protein